MLNQYEKFKLYTIRKNGERSGRRYDIKINYLEIFITLIYMGGGREKAV